MLTTDGSSCLASCENAVDNWTGFGITSGVAPGAGVSLAAFTPVLTRVPIRIPIDKVNRIKLEETSFLVRIVFRKLITLPTTSALSCIDYYNSRAISMDVSQRQLVSVPLPGCLPGSSPHPIQPAPAGLLP